MTGTRTATETAAVATTTETAVAAMVTGTAIATMAMAMATVMVADVQFLVRGRALGGVMIFAPSFVFLHFASPYLGKECFSNYGQTPPVVAAAVCACPR